MNNKVRILLTCLIWGVTTLAGAVEYIQPQPFMVSLKDTARVGNVRSGTVELPIISWGADIATIYANGNGANTAGASLFGQAGLDFKLVREDVFARQIEKYMSGQTPYLRGTMGMINMAGDLLAKDSRTRPIIIAKLSDSAGGDALVVKDTIKTVSSLKGKTIVLQAYGPHIDYLNRILHDAGLSLADVKVRWVRDLTGTANSPAEAFRQKDIDAAFVITPDALALTSNGAVGTGAEDSVRGARVLMSTKTANKVIVDVYAVRSDYLEQNRAKVEAFVAALLKAQEQVNTLVANSKSQKADYQNLMRASAKLLLDAETAIADAEGMYGDAQIALFNGNKSFFTNANNVRRFDVIAKESLTGVKEFGLVSGTVTLTAQAWDFARLQGKIGQVKAASGSRFDERAAAAAVNKLQQQGRLAEGELYSFDVFFAPNQNSFTADLYKDAFNRVIELASTYGGALITVEGHSDPMQYLKSKKAGESVLVLGQIKQAAKNLSYSRAQSVRDSILSFAKTKSINLDASQFVVAGQGISMPSTGICGEDPCAPKNEAEWRSNMRVVFRIVQVEAESSVFKPL
jgi:ABC-type nitrate/sulfonate/bicarbonate transport system substrate-binding protein